MAKKLSGGAGEPTYVAELLLLYTAPRSFDVLLVAAAAVGWPAVRSVMSTLDWFNGLYPDTHCEIRQPTPRQRGTLIERRTPVSDRAMK